MLCRSLIRAIELDPEDEPFICRSGRGCRSWVFASAYAVVDQAQNRCIEAIRSRTG
jgi:hypothetical protein